MVARFRAWGIDDERTAMANDWSCIRRLTGFFALVTFLGLGGCCASGPQRIFQTAYSAIGAQIK
jgi:hypothetical protein